MAFKRPSRNCGDTYRHGLSRFEVSAIRFRNLRHGLPRRHIWNLSHSLTGTRGVADLKLRKLLTEENHILVTVLLNVHVTRGLRFKNHVIDRALRVLRRDRGSLNSSALNRNTGGGGFLLVF